MHGIQFKNAIEASAMITMYAELSAHGQERDIYR